MQDLHEAYRTMNYLKSTADEGIVISPIPIKYLQLATFSDSSWANAPGGKTQAGLLLCAVDGRDLTKPSLASILDWKSFRIKRTVHSTLAAEANAMDAAVVHAWYASCFLG